MATNLATGETTVLAEVVEPAVDAVPEAEQSATNFIAPVDSPSQPASELTSTDGPLTFVDVAADCEQITLLNPNADNNEVLAAEDAPPQPTLLTPPYKCTLQVHAPLAGRLLGGNTFHQDLILAKLKTEVVDKQIAIVDGNYVACGAWVIILHGQDIELMKKAVREAIGGLQGDSYFRQTITLDGGQRYSKVVPYAE